MVVETSATATWHQDLFELIDENIIIEEWQPPQIIHSAYLSLGLCWEENADFRVVLLCTP